MNNFSTQEFNNYLSIIDSISSSIDREKYMKLLLNLSKKSFPDNKIKNKKIAFTKKEIESMPQKFKESFIANNKIINYRYYKGMFQARYRKDGFNIEVASHDFNTMKQKFLDKLNENNKELNINTPENILFSKYSESWLKIKENTVKASTYKEYLRLYKTNIEPKFGAFKLCDIKREDIQNYLFEFIKNKNHRTAEKIKLQLSCIFDMAADDFNITSPMKKIVLPFFQSKKGSALTYEEEKELVTYCLNNLDRATSHAFLILLYTGLRRSELASMKIIDNTFLECDTSKERMGKNIVKRQIPFTPIFKKIINYVDFEKARTVKMNTISSSIKIVFKNHHLHELRYTFITRCKECGVNPEVVMLWDGHEQDSFVKSSKVDRGYTTYSNEYILSEAKKVDYKI